MALEKSRTNAEHLQLLEQPRLEMQCCNARCRSIRRDGPESFGDSRDTIPAD
jgi:hypothetical protein